MSSFALNQTQSGLERSRKIQELTGESWYRCQGPDRVYSKDIRQALCREFPADETKARLGPCVQETESACGGSEAAKGKEVDAGVMQIENSYNPIDAFGVCKNARFYRGRVYANTQFRDSKLINLSSNISSNRDFNAPYMQGRWRSQSKANMLHPIKLRTVV